MCLFTTRLFVLHNIKWLGKISHCQQRPSKRRHLQTLTHVVLEVGICIPVGVAGRPVAVYVYRSRNYIFGRAIAHCILRANYETTRALALKKLVEQV